MENVNPFIPHGNEGEGNGKDLRIFIEDEKTNVASTVITITQDKLENILLKHNNAGEKFRWAIPLPVFLSISLTLLTTSGFKDFGGRSPEFWNALFHIVAVAFFLWTFLEFFLLWKNRKNLSLESLIDKIKGSG